MSADPGNGLHVAYGGPGPFVSFTGGTQTDTNCNDPHCRAWYPAPEDHPVCGHPSAPCTTLPIGPDTHSVAFSADGQVLLASTDFGPFTSRDGGLSWRHGKTAFADRLRDGPPVSEWYRLSVSDPDPWGRVAVGGGIQDHGALMMMGRPAGMSVTGGEMAMHVVARSIDPVGNTSVVRTWSTNDAYSELYVCDVKVPAPDYFAPGTDRENQYPYPDLYGAPGDSCVTRTGMSKMTAIVPHPLRADTALIAKANGDVVRIVHTRGSSATDVRTIANFTASGGVTSLRYMTPIEVLVGLGDGRVARIHDPNGTASVQDLTKIDSAGDAVVAVGSRLISGGIDAIAATARTLYRSTWSGGAMSWIAMDAPPDMNEVAIIGVELDPASPSLYVATGVPSITSPIYARHFAGLVAGWRPRPGQQSPNPYAGHKAVWRRGIPLSLTSRTPPSPGPWETFDQGLPVGTPVSGIGMSPNGGLFISTQGRGVWWRRDVAAAGPQGGVNAPRAGSSRAGHGVSIVTTCEYPGGWRKIRTLDFKLARGLGAEAGRPFAAWMRLDQDGDRVGIYDESKGDFVFGRAGERRVIHTAAADLDLSRTSVRGLDPARPAVEITWGLILRSGGDLQQFLQVSDDAGATTSWDRVGAWHVASARSMRPRWVGVVVAIALLAGGVIALRRRSTRRSRPSPLANPPS
jgi:hypothetical protein